MESEKLKNAAELIAQEIRSWADDDKYDVSKEPLCWGMVIIEVASHVHDLLKGDHPWEEDRTRAAMREGMHSEWLRF